MEKKKPKRKPTPETQRRKSEILEMIKNGLSNTNIINTIKSKYNIKDSQAYSLLHQSILDLQEANVDIDIDKIKVIYTERIESMLEKSLNSGDIRTALRCQDMLNKMNGLYVDKQELTVTNDIIKFKFDS